jgi:predicted ATPase
VPLSRRKNQLDIALFRRLEIFMNGFTLEGAVAVDSGKALDERDVLDMRSSFVDKSLCATRREHTALSDARIDARIRHREARGRK